MTERAAPRPALTPLEWRLYLGAALAGIYLIAWRAVAGSSVAPAPEVATAAAPRTVWLDDLPAAQRPAVAIPPGWRLAAHDRAAPPAPHVARVPATRPMRVRTRSS